MEIDEQPGWPAGCRKKKEEEEMQDEYSSSDHWVLDSSVDRFGNVPVRAETGVWRAALFVIFIEFAERLSYFGLATNLIIYLTKVMHQDITTAAKNVNYWTGVTTIMPLVGGFVADSYLGRFPTVLLSSLLYLAGLVLLTISEFAPSLKPCQEESCLKRHDALFFTSMYIISVATGGHKPALESFGADQFDGDHPEERRKKMSYFNWWNAALCAGLVLGVTCVVYIQDYIGWGVADVVLTATMAVGLVIFCVGRPCYRYRIPQGSPMTPMAQVLVAAVAKRHLPLPSNPAELHEIPASSSPGGKKLLCRTSYLSCLDKAAVVEVIEHKGSDDLEAMAQVEIRQPWRLSTVTQVEETKLVLGVIPVWLTTQMFGLCVAQASTFFIKQGSTMDRRIGGFEIPPASIYSLGAIGMLISVTFYDKLLVPFLRRTTGNERGVSILQRIGIGMALSIVAMSTAAAVERKRLGVAAVEGTATVSMSVFWLAPQYMVLGVADGFALVGLQEYFYEQVPDGMRSVGIAFYLSVIGAANFLSSALITVVDHATRRTASGSWFAKDLNRSRLDCFYWLLAALNGVNLCVYFYVSSRYSSKSVQKKKKKKVACAESGREGEECGGGGAGGGSVSS